MVMVYKWYIKFFPYKNQNTTENSSPGFMSRKAVDLKACSNSLFYDNLLSSTQILKFELFSES